MRHKPSKVLCIVRSDRFRAAFFWMALNGNWEPWLASKNGRNVLSVYKRFFNFLSAWVIVRVRRSFNRMFPVNKSKINHFPINYIGCIVFENLILRREKGLMRSARRDIFPISENGLKYYTCISYSICYWRWGWGWGLL